MGRPSGRASILDGEAARQFGVAPQHAKMDANLLADGKVYRRKRQRDTQGSLEGTIGAGHGE